MWDVGELYIKKGMRDGSAHWLGERAEHKEGDKGEVAGNAIG